MINHGKKIVSHATLFGICLILIAVAASAQNYTVNVLTTDVVGMAPNSDPNLINPIGLARGILGPWWVANNGTPKSTLYGGDGGPRGLIVTLDSYAGSSNPTKATGIVFGGNAGFNVTPGNSALFLFSTMDGTILAWSPFDFFHTFNAVVMVDRHGQASYTGLALAEIGTASFLYAVNALNGSIEMFDTNFQSVTLGRDAFHDPNMPHDFAPFNVQNIGQDIVVTYSRRVGMNSDGPQGWVAIFDARGRFLSRLQSGPWLNAPWGITMTPHDFGEFSHMLVVANHGNGQVAAFDPFTGRFAGLMLDANGNVLSIDGLWAIDFGDGGISDFTGTNTGAYNACYFTAGTHEGLHGAFGNVIPVQSQQTHDEE
jgi:uncharacterized protein (TIGR03118 family)